MAATMVDQQVSETCAIHKEVRLRLDVVELRDP